MGRFLAVFAPSDLSPSVDPDEAFVVLEPEGQGFTWTGPGQQKDWSPTLEEAHNRVRAISEHSPWSGIPGGDSDLRELARTTRKTWSEDRQRAGAELLARIRQALERVDPAHADEIVLELEYATGKDPRLTSRQVALAASADSWVSLDRIVKAVGEMENEFAGGARLRWSLIPDERFPRNAQKFLRLDAGEIRAWSSSRDYAERARWIFRDRATGKTDTSPRVVEVMHATFPGLTDFENDLEPAGDLEEPWSSVDRAGAALHECFPDMADALLRDLWMRIARRPASRNFNVSLPFPTTPESIAATMQDLLGQIEQRQPERIRRRWSLTVEGSEVRVEATRRWQV